MKSRIFFFLSLVAFFNPISVMAEGLRTYKIDSKLACKEFVAGRKAAAPVTGSSTVKTKKEGQTSGNAS